MDQSKHNFLAVGLMSGTSLDGLDLALVQFNYQDSGWKYEVLKAATRPYTKVWRQKLEQAPKLSAIELFALHAAYGKLLATEALAFLEKETTPVDLIASHGHTIFHQPAKGFTFQLGNPTTLFALTGIPVVADFRSTDIAFHGQGAPLVPVGDEWLFSDYDICLNFGGIANLSYKSNGSRRAYDIVFCNMLFNYLASKKGKQYDKNGRMADSGEINTGMLGKLQTQFAKYRKKRPSLSRELFERDFKKILDGKLSVEDKMATALEFVALEIATAIREVKNPTVLCTGGGALNPVLISRLMDCLGDEASLILPDKVTIDFKEAIVFAFLGVLKVKGQVNSLASVTGAKRDSSGGVIIN